MWTVDHDSVQNSNDVDIAGLSKQRVLLGEIWKFNFEVSY